MEKVKMFNGKMLEIGDKIYLADLWQSDDGDEEELLDSGCLFCACGYNVSKMYTNCFRNVSTDIDLGLDIDLD